MTMLTANALALADIVRESAVVTARLVEDRLGGTPPMALRLLRPLEDRGDLSDGRVGHAASGGTLRGN